MARNIALNCGHPEGFATLHRGEAAAWCPVCEADVEVEILPEPAGWSVGCPRCNGADTVALVGGRWECICGWRMPETPAFIPERQEP